ncbi:MAG: hypothetical protein LBL48_03140 [Azoarcus sp.]|nr:hypothetical protein [Azoarcus sp.]
MTGTGAVVRAAGAGRVFAAGREAAGFLAGVLRNGTLLQAARINAATTIAPKRHKAAPRTFIV